MIELIEELNYHTELMFFKLCKTLKDASSLCDEGYWALMKSANTIFDEKHPKLKKKKPQTNKNMFFEETVGRLALNHEDRYFSISWAIEDHEKLKALLTPTYNNKPYEKVLQDLLDLEETPTTFGEKLLYITTGIWFYNELGKSDTYSLEKQLPNMLKVDRALSYIREDIAAAVATNHNRVKNAESLTKTQIQNEINLIGSNDEFIKVVTEVQNESHEEKIKLNKFATRVVKRMTEDIDIKTAINRLKKYGSTSNNFAERLKTKTILTK